MILGRFRNFDSFRKPNVHFATTQDGPSSVLEIGKNGTTKVDDTPEFLPDFTHEGARCLLVRFDLPAGEFKSATQMLRIRARCG